MTDDSTIIMCWGYLCVFGVILAEASYYMGFRWEGR